jgi:hypothetical protein
VATDFTIKNAETGEFFGGFADGVVRWVKFACDAWQADMARASAQADLLICNGIPAQRKVVAL